MAQEKSKMGLGLLVGLVAGAIGGIFLAPKSGKENREALTKKMNDMKDALQSGEAKKRVEEIFGDISDESVKMYNQARKAVVDGIEDMKSMDKDDYAKLVQNAVEAVKERANMTAEQFTKMKDSFMKDMPQMKKEAEEKVEKTKKEAKAKLLAEEKKVK